MAATLLDHLIELRSKLLVSLFAIAVGTAAAHPFHEAIAAYLLKPLGGERIVFLSPLDPLLFILKIDLLAGTLFALPVITWAVLSFVRPAVSRTRWPSLLLVYGVSLACAAGSLFYGWFVSVPAGLRFLLGLSVPGIDNLVTAASYLRFLLASAFLLVLVSQIPIVVVAGLRYGIFDAAAVTARRGHVYLLATLVLSMLTPTTDPLNLLLVLAPTALLFEVSLVAGRIMTRPRG